MGGDAVAVRRIHTRDRVGLRGHLRLQVLDEAGQVVDDRAGDNVITTAGYTILAAAMAWSGVQDQAANLGISSPTYLTPLFGAVGSGSGTPAKSDLALFSELGRQTVGGPAASPATPTIAAESAWLFYFPNPSVPWTVTEAGLFAQATSTAGSGILVDHWAFSPSVTVPTNNSLILQVSLALGP